MSKTRTILLKNLNITSEDSYTIDIAAKNNFGESKERLTQVITVSEFPMSKDSQDVTLKYRNGQEAYSALSCGANLNVECINDSKKLPDDDVVSVTGVEYFNYYKGDSDRSATLELGPASTEVKITFGELPDANVGGDGGDSPSGYSASIYYTSLSFLCSVSSNENNWGSIVNNDDRFSYRYDDNGNQFITLANNGYVYDIYYTSADGGKLYANASTPITASNSYYAEVFSAPTQPDASSNKFTISKEGQQLGEYEFKEGDTWSAMPERYKGVFSTSADGSYICYTYEGKTYEIADDTKAMLVSNKISVRDYALKTW